MVKIKNKSVGIVGSGYIAEQYSLALSNMGIYDVEIVGRSKKSLDPLCKKFDFKSILQDYKVGIKNISKKDLLIITLPIQDLIPAAALALKSNQKNILIEKPGSLFSKNLINLQNKKHSAKIFVAYNRLFYPNFKKVIELTQKEGGITSCNFSFTEWIDKINLKKYDNSILSRWGIANSLHVISMAFRLIGIPKKMACYQSGTISWHKSGSVFSGSGVSTKGIPFTYNADWTSSGRWGIEVKTKKNSYRLSPLEQLSRCPKNSISWLPVEFNIKYPDVKQGLSEQLLALFSEKNDSKLVSLKEAAKWNKIAEQIFRY